MDFWEKIQKDVSKGIKEGIHTLKEKAELLTDEGKRKYKAYDMKSQIHKHMAELGAAVYAAGNAGKDPMGQANVKALVTKIAKLESELNTVEKAKKKTKKKAVKKKAKKKAVKKKAVKK